MITYTVHESPGAPAERLDRAESLAFVKEGFSWGAALLTPFWLIVHRLWLALLLYLAAIALIQGGFWWLELDQGALAYAMLALHAVIGYEADTIRRWTLGRGGWRMVGSVNGRNAEDCERRFLEAWLPGQPYVRRDALAGSALAAQAEPPPLSGGTGAGAAATDGRRGGWRSAFSIGRRG